jgi:hypothetical protein
MGTKTTFICDCCLREADNNLGWARVSVNGASDGKQIMPDDNRDLCEICWSPLQTLMKKVHDEACAFRRRRPRCPAHGDHVIRSMTTRAAHELDGAVGCVF